MDIGTGPVGALGRAGLLARNWWAIGLRGVLAVLFGAVALAQPGLALQTLVVLFGLYMLVDGISALTAGLWSAARHERWALLAVEGALDFAAASVALLAPVATVLALVYLAGAWAVLTGTALFAAAFSLRVLDGRWLMALGATVSVLWGALLFAWPVTAALVMTWWLGGYAIVFGVVMLALAARLWGIGRPRPTRRAVRRSRPF